VELELTVDQESFCDATRKFLDAEWPMSRVRELRTSKDGFDRAYWRQGANIGWTSLLVSNEDGGGTISSRGLIDLTLIAHEFGRRALPGPLIPCAVVAATLSRWGSAAQKHDVLDGLLSGDVIATWCFAEPRPYDSLGTIGVKAVHKRDRYRLTGIKGPVEAAAQADHLLVTARAPSGLMQLLVPAQSRGVAITPLDSLDVTRRFAEVSFDNVDVGPANVVGTLAFTEAEVERQLQIAVALTIAEMVGAMERVFEFTLDWAFDRYSFGRPLASYQELKHRFADMGTWLEASHAISSRAIRAIQDATGDAAELASVAKSYIGSYGPELVQDCVQMHGGIGVTYDHDVHLYLRRVIVDSVLYGTPAEHRQRIVGLLEHAEKEQ
jgi:alkylation response protein AidB-like acyl-CoA dehydrogenase